MNIHAHGDGLRRRDEILRIVGEQSVHSQDELLALLKKRGFRVTQPTLSRDLRELGVAKIAERLRHARRLCRRRGRRLRAARRRRDAAGAGRR